MQSAGAETTPTFRHDTQFGSGPEDAPSGYRPPRPLRLSFTGDGWEYFGIWAVNVLLSILTLGIYSAWAKVRTLRFFYRHTRLDDAGFDYHGTPGAILKGRVVMFVVAFAVQFAGSLNPALGLILSLVLAALFPALLVRSLRFRMANSSYRALRFAFTGSTGEGYKVFLLWPVLAVLSLFTLAPLAHQRFKAYQHRNTRYGTALFSFDAEAGAFYGLYLRTFGLSLAAWLCAAVGAWMLFQFMAGGASDLLPAVPHAAEGLDGIGRAFVLTVAGMVAYFLLASLVGAYFMAGAQNLVWNHTRLGPHAFASEVRAGALCRLYLLNALCVVLTLGLFTPFAAVRAVRYRVQCMTLLAAQPLDTFVGAEREQVGALGDAAVDWYDIDIAL